MNNLKRIVPVFIIGFLLSFFAGIIGGVRFGVIILRAILSGGILFILSYSIVIVYNKFLSNGGVHEIDKTDTGAVKSEHVDIVIEDDLPDSATAPAFDLSNYVAPPIETETEVEAITSSDSPENLQSEEVLETASFQNSTLDTITNSNVSSVTKENEDVTEKEDVVSSTAVISEGVEANNYASYENAEVIQGEDESELGELPDIESLAVDDDGDVSGDSDEVVQDSVFAETGAVKPSSEPVAVSEMGDAKDIAAAIRTAMAKDV